MWYHGGPAQKFRVGGIPVNGLPISGHQIEPGAPTLQADSFPAELPGSPSKFLFRGFGKRKTPSLVMLAAGRDLCAHIQMVV